ncbi:hypothetical protein [Clostridium sp.]|uniref:hypothetical protein n=1 Tax=Clostridium sp. TaxID=1506 RepID=UPI0028407807|nr:hypothetical protein [Clostridium sp.]MDR3598628.1 hypothetical protein [Clostridium sp.]
MNAQYVSNANLEITRNEREENNYNLKTTFIMSVSTFALIIGGILSILTDLLI